jgi:hypothetical protein
MSEHDEAQHEPPPHDETADEPLGPMTPDEERPLGDTPEAHDEINPHDIPKDNPGRQEAERLAGGEDGTTGGNV